VRRFIVYYLPLSFPLIWQLIVQFKTWVTFVATFAVLFLLPPSRLCILMSLTLGALRG
jgi:hypothetical protein